VTDNGTPDITLDAELYSAETMKSDLERAAAELERAAAELREAKADIDRVTSSGSSSYLEVALDAQRAVDRGIGNAEVWRAAKSAGTADLARARKAQGQK